MAAPLAIPQAEPPPVPKRGLDTPFSGNSNGSQSREGAPSTATAPPQLRAHPFIRALPASVSFQASETGAEQHAFLTLKNVDAVRTHSVRILPPTPECFGVVSASRVVKLAPGIETKVKVGAWGY